MNGQHRQRGRLFFYGIFIILAVLVLYFLSPYLAVIAVGVVAAVVLKPLYDWFMNRKRVKGRPRLAVTLTLLTFFLAIFIPLFVVGVTFIGEMQEASDEVQSEETQAELEEDLAVVEDTLEDMGVTEEEVADALLAVAQGFLTWLGDLLASMGGTLMELLIGGVVFLIVVASLLPNSEALGQRIRTLSPLGGDITRIYQVKTREMIASVIKGVFLVAFIQGLIMGFFYWLAGVPYWTFFMLLSMAFALLPVVGISYIVLFMAFVFLANGNTTSALIVLFGFYAIVNPLDVILRPRLVSKEAYLNFTLMLLALFGGMAVGGFLGMIFGPVVMILFVTTLDIFTEYYSDEPDDAIVVTEGGSPAPPGELDSGSNTT
jgi:predicted PurR-regulated permease PerM